MRSTEDDKMKMFYSNIFEPITTARFHVVAENSGVYSWDDNKFIDFLVSWVGTRSSLGMR